ncbi:MAG: hypothetical protein DWQ36_18475 [Acidobacteria bacterium]|nr:MAG: hypothetical protein DWQ30_13175 [Acidobacteriota bacterium]REK04412.1 MAG: hypothetical protein DWQ36_18475 [Acidobacteriota bacterium]
MTRLATALALTLALLVLATPAIAEVLVLIDGARIQTRGPWEERGRQVVYTDEHGNLAAIRASLVDLEASRAAGQEVAREDYVRIDHPAPKPRPSKAPPGRPGAEPVVITQGDVTATLDPEAQRVAAIFSSLDQWALVALAHEFRSLALELLRLDRQHNLLLRDGIRNAAPAFRNLASRFSSQAATARIETTASAYQLLSDHLLDLAAKAETRPAEAIAAIRAPMLDLRGYLGKDHRPGQP